MSSDVRFFFILAKIRFELSICRMLNANSPLFWLLNR